MKNCNRRDFFKTLGLVAGGLLAAKIITPSQALAQRTRGGKAAGGAVPLIGVDENMAKAVKYVEDHKKAPAAKGNSCANCNFYAKKETRNGKEVGTCLIFPNKYVYANAYCNSWVKKA